MPIKGVTDQHKLSMEKQPNGRPVVLGYLKKGERDGFGKGAKLHDRDYFVFTPAQDGQQGSRVKNAFEICYGKEPRIIPDVRIDCELAGNLNLEDRAWLISRKHGASGSVFLGKSDGEYIHSLRGQDGKIIRYDEGERPLLEDVCKKVNDKGERIYQYLGKPWPFQQEMTIDLILPALNEHLGDRGFAIYGIVTLILRGRNEVPNIIGEINSIIQKAASVMSNPFKEGDYENAMRYLPLQSIPLALFRQNDSISAPNYKSSNKADRIKITKSLVHISLNNDFARSMMRTLNQRTQLTLQAAAGVSLLAPPKEKESLEDFNASVFGGGEVKAIPVKSTRFESPSPRFEDSIPVGDSEVAEGEYVDDGPDWSGATDWLEECAAARSVDELSYRYFQLDKGRPASVFKDANSVKKAIEHMLSGIEIPTENMTAVVALDKYASSIVDGATKKQAVLGVMAWWEAEGAESQDESIQPALVDAPTDEAVQYE